MNAVTAKGQVTIPKPIRDLLGIGPGSKVAFVMDAAGQIVLRKADGSEDAPAAGRFGRFLGAVRCDMTTDEIMALTRGEDG